jgi:23S rRNA (uracil1939-C5)-methyltransferase
MTSELQELTLAGLTYGGEAMGRLDDGRAVFIPFGMPGERVRVRLTEQKRSFSRGEIVEILGASPERISPRCKHFGKCGGCHYQHMPYEAQLRAKAEILRDQLQRIGRIQNPPLQPTMPCPDPWNYRNHIQFHLDDAGKLAYLAPNSNRVIPVSECHLPEPAVNLLWPQLDFESGTGVERVSIRAGTDGDLMLVLESDSPEAPELEIEAGISVAHVFDGQAVIIAGENHVMINVQAEGLPPRAFRVSPASFFQVNTVMAGKMVHHLLSRLPIERALVLEVYCGVGLFSAFLATKCGRLIGVESSASACEDFAVNLDEFENVELYEDFAENVLPALRARPDIVLADPPRTGIAKEALDAILNMSPRTIAYVSCDPSTLGRDAARLLQAGYRLSEVTPFDVFPQTYHIESISIFEK